ncbi:MAG TPA: Gfo/Idh/MocA family oxidoreductase [Anaeromyxobacter sp.]|nr:Gfo/Idh/MocA family oxidoreductase [Anaeromyxobacter sp.]
MTPLRFAVFGAGFWTRPQLAAWAEVPGARCVAIYNRTREKAERMARAFDIPAVYGDPLELLRREKLDFVDIITAPESHEEQVLLVASHGLPVICQKPMSTSLASAERMVEGCARAKVPFFVHENWRWQQPFREIKRELEAGTIGKPFRARLVMISGFPVFQNQPALKEMERFVIADMGSHQLDVARYLFGEAESVFAHAGRVHPDIRGEDVATIMVRMRDRTTVVVDLGYPENFIEHENLPETWAFIEGAKGSIELAPDYWLRVTTESGTRSRRIPPPHRPWIDPYYEPSEASGVPCNANLLSAIRGEGQAETTGADNLQTVRLVFAAYRSAETGQAVLL